MGPIPDILPTEKWPKSPCDIETHISMAAAFLVARFMCVCLKSKSTDFALYALSPFFFPRFKFSTLRTNIDGMGIGVTCGCFYNDFSNMASWMCPNCNVIWICRTLNDRPNACNQVCSDINDMCLSGGSFFGCCLGV